MSDPIAVTLLVAAGTITAAMLVALIVISYHVATTEGVTYPVTYAIDDIEGDAEVAETHKKAIAGDAAAQFAMGKMYHQGRGVAQNYSRAYFWSILAAAQGYETATKDRDEVAKLLPPEEIIKVQELATQRMQARL